MPTKNRRDLIQDAIQSIIEQTFDDWELIVIDDHGEDNTAEIIKLINNPQIKYYFLRESLGPGGARDFGIKQSDGAVIVLADSDDLSLGNRLKLTYEVFEKDNCDVSYGLTILQQANGSQTTRPSHEFNADLLKAHNYISNPTAAFKKELYLKTSGYDFKLRTSEDYDLWLTFLEEEAQFKFISHPLVLQKIHEESTLLDVALEQRKKNLNYIRQKHHLPVPKFEDVKKLIKNKELLDFISTPGAIDFWFNF